MPVFFFCVPSYISEVHHSSSASPAISLGFTILLLLCSQLYLWGSPFFFFCVPSYISGVHPSSSSAFPAISLGFTILLLLCSQLYYYLGFTILLLRSQLYLWGSPFFFFCVPSFISGVHHSSSAFPAISLGFTILLLCSQLYYYLGFTILLLRSQLYLWGSPFFFFCVPSYISGVHHSSSSVFPAISLGFTILLLLCSQLYYYLGFTILLLLRSPAISLGFIVFGMRILRMWPFFVFNFFY